MSRTNMHSYYIVQIGTDCCKNVNFILGSNLTKFKNKNKNYKMK
jgi:hypothetical protein